LSLLEEIRIFLIEVGQLLIHSEDTRWARDQISLTDICGHQNNLNSKPQQRIGLPKEIIVI
jgi:hypothetical protein